MRFPWRGSAVAAISVLAFGGTIQAAAAASAPFSCSIGRFGYYDCASDNYTVPPGHQTSIKVTSIVGGSCVQFKMFNKNGHHLLWTGPSCQGVVTGPVRAWYNNTSSNILIDIMAQDGFDGCYVAATITY